MSRRSPFLDRRAVFSSAAAAVLLAATGVGASGIPARGGRLRMALSGGARSDSWVQGNGLFMQVARQGLIYDTLTEVAADGTLRAELALGWQASPDARTWDFDLRCGVHFHDGTGFSAADAVASLRDLIGGEVSAPRSDRLRISLAEPDPGLPLLLAGPDFVIRPAHAPAAGIGTGLYRLRRFRPGQQLLATRVASHFRDGSAGWFDEVELTSIPSEAVRGQALGEYLVDAVDIREAGALAGVPDVHLMPDSRHPAQAVSNAVAQPAQVGRLHPLDNLRAAERWWFA
ncbi:peptide ABC transporter substrate-binding protein [Sulfitobacter alexandrii]|uniref:Peptide ABC transporter substrate-binding protein n=1 Tax=Sulfitobacter alexandrii TaxID=1917485 RepID=A0A1J0WLH7_9RHOB|nr:ABC transporter substrate-binding protein [Sulfitobacter alexandrii]APE45154.1 peptide ABC transporter substrate-binding protein [Sulfitobacter alexandrii]